MDCTFTLSSQRRPFLAPLASSYGERARNRAAANRCAICLSVVFGCSRVRILRESAAMPGVLSRIAGMTLVATMVATSVAPALPDSRYVGVTSQGLPVRLTVGGHGVSLFTIRLRERCYTRQGRFVGVFPAFYSFTSYPPLDLNRRGRFTHHELGNNFLDGVIHGRTAAGTYKQTTPYYARGRCVTGKVHWSAHAH